MQEKVIGMMGSSSSYGGGLGDQFSGDQQLKAEIASHPLYEQVLAAHVSCLRVATPVNELPLIDAQLNQSHHILSSYLQQHNSNRRPLSTHERQELDNFLVSLVLLIFLL